MLVISSLAFLRRILSLDSFAQCAGDNGRKGEKTKLQTNTPYSKMTAISVFFCLLAN